MAISSTRRGLRARPKTKSTRFASHQAISASRAKPLSARSRMRTRGQRARIRRDDARDLLHGAGRGVDVGAAELGRQQVPAAEDVERQVAVGVVVAVEEAALLVPVQRDVGGVEVEDDLPRGRAVRVEEEVHEQRLDRGGIVADPVVAAGLARRRVLQPVQRALAGQRRAVRTPRRQLAGEHGQHRIVAQLVVVEQVLVAERDAEDALADQSGRSRARPAPASRASRKQAAKRRDQADGPVRRAEQQRAGIRGDRSAVEAGHHSAALNRCKLEQRRATLRRHRGPPLHRRKALSQKNFRRFRAPMHLHS